MPSINNLSDEELVKIIRNKNKELYAEIVGRYQDKLMRYVTYLIKDENKAADIVQEGFIKAYINLNGFNTKKKFSSWIYRITHNETLNFIKKYHRETSIDEVMDFSSKTNLEEEFSKKEIIEMTHKCLGDIPAKYSEPLILYYLEDRSYEEISDILRMPMGTVAIRINRAKAQMRKICQKK